MFSTFKDLKSFPFALDNLSSTEGTKVMPGNLRHILAYCLLGVAYILITSHPVVGAEPKHIAEVNVYVDGAGFTNWKKKTGKSSIADLRTDISNIFMETNEVFRSLERRNQIHLQMQVNQVVFVPQVITIFHVLKPLNGFLFWIDRKYKNKEPDYDLAVLFTGFHLKKEVVYGEAERGAVCLPNSVAIVSMTELLLGKTSVAGRPRKISFIVAHEIGHILGAQHDEYFKECPDKTYVMMKATDFSSGNMIHFSNCSADAIRKTIDTKNGQGKNCLLTQRKMTADQACQKKEGINFYLTRGIYKTYSDNFCKELVCISRTSDKAEFQTKKSKTPDGLGCGKNKECKDGKCVSVTNGDPNMSDECPWGDQDLKSLAYTNNCSQQNCEKWSLWCCNHCQGK